MSNKLIKLNDFTQGENRVWFDASQGDVDFGYSDGQEIEQRLKAIFTNASDLSCTSYELKSHISDWPTEYHLTPVRSNLIRALDLTGVKRVLELGCGCGSISRYLGDVKHADGSVIQVDSIEGSPVRAELAALRCRDLDNVTVSTANFNQIKFPENYYDLVLYVGVTEYAGRFSDRETDTEALQDLLALAKRAATKDGIVMVAIENRTGMKYVQGANEDHYAKPYVGIHNYAQPAGIRTYTKGEWQEQITLAGFTQQEFIYPFPDYKIPTIFLGEDYVDQNPFSFNHLEACRSRDYVRIFDFASREALFWESAAATQTMGEFANSFMILMGDNPEKIEKMSRYDFLHLPSYERNLEFCMSIAKPKGEDHIVREYIDDDLQKRQQIIDLVEHCRIEKEPFFQGTMLSVEWSRSLISYPELNVFEQFLRDYFAFLQNRQQSKQLTIDLLPSNIVVQKNAESEINPKHYQVVDEEWQLKGALADKLSAELVYFRAILFFYMVYPDFVEDKIIAQKKLHTLQDLLAYSFAVIDKRLQPDQILEYADVNEQFQNLISSRPANIDYQTILNKLDNISALRWKLGDESFSANSSISISGDGQFQRETLRFNLPATVRQIDSLQFLPCGEKIPDISAFFRVYAWRLLAVNNKAETRELFALDSEQTIAESVLSETIEFREGSAGLGYYFIHTHTLPSLILDISHQICLGSEEFLRCEIEARYPLGEHGQIMLEQSAEMFAIQQQLDALKNSRSYLLANKLTVVAGRLRQLKTMLNRLLRRITAKKKVVNNTSSVHWCTETSELNVLANESVLVSIVIPFRDKPELLKKCITSIVDKTSYAHYEIIAVSNDSVSRKTQKVCQDLLKQYPQLRFIEHNIPFNFSALVNQGVAVSKGDYLVLLNNDIEISSSDWIESLLQKAALEKVAVVGGRLDYPDGRIQHLGLHIGVNKLPEHSFKEMHHSVLGLQPYLRQSRYVTAVTGAMMMVSLQIWNELDGFEEEQFGVAFNDVDFCLRAIEKGYQNVLNPDIVALHHESVSRGYENTVEKMRRFRTEQTRFIERHEAYIKQGDHYFSVAS